MNKRNDKRWREYERQKAALQREGLSPTEYEDKLRELAKRLRL